MDDLPPTKCFMLWHAVRRGVSIGEPVPLSSALHNFDLSLQMGTLNLPLNRRRLTKLKLPHPFGPWNLWRPFLGCRNIQSFSQFFLGHEININSP